MYFYLRIPLKLSTGVAAAFKFSISSNVRLPIPKLYYVPISYDSLLSFIVCFYITEPLSFVPKPHSHLSPIKMAIRDQWPW